MLDIDRETAELKRRIAGYVSASGTNLTGIYGIGPIIAARFLAEVVDINRYPNRNAFASVNGTAPLAASSGRTQRNRYNPGGNRRLNNCLYTIAITQARADTEGRAYYLRKREAGKTSKEALRCLKRRLSDIVYSAMRRDADGVDAACATRARPTANGQQRDGDPSPATPLFSSSDKPRPPTSRPIPTGLAHRGPSWVAWSDKVQSRAALAYIPGVIASRSRTFGRDTRGKT